MTNKLPEEDPLGAVPGIAVFVLLVAGNLGSTLAMQRTGAAAARRRVASLICRVVIAALVINRITGPILDAYPDADNGNALTQPLIVLSVYVVVGAALVVFFTYGRLRRWRRGTKGRPPISPREEGGTAAIPPA